MIKKLLYLSNLAFLALYLVLSWHNRLTLDDFHFMENLHSHGIIQGTVTEYSFFSTRWISVFVVHCVLSLMPYVNALFLFNLLTLISIVFAFSYLLKSIFNHFPIFGIDLVLLMNLGIFLTNAFFYSSMDIGNIWFWLSALPTYLWSFIFFLLGCGLILSSKKSAVLKFGLLALSFSYIGGSAETFAAIVLLGLLITLLWLHFFKSSLPDRKIYLARLYVAFFFCLLSLIILYLGHGNTVRRGLIGEISIPKAILLNIGTTGWIGLHWISHIVPVVVLFSLPALYGGKILSSKNPELFKTPTKLGSILFKAALVYGVLIYLINYPITYLLCGLAPGRALAPVSFLTWSLFVFAFFLIGYKAVINQKIVEKLATLVLGICIVFNIYNGVHQFIVTREYDINYDALMQELTDKNDNNSVIEVSPLPSSGMLTPLDISHDSLAHNNMFIKKALGLQADIVLRKE